MIRLIKIPQSFLRPTENTEDVDKLMNDFFINIKDYIKSKKGADDSNFHIKSADLAYSSDKVNSNNRITYVEYEERYIVAGMLETRNAFNNLQFTFFRDLTCLEETASEKMLKKSNKRLEDIYCIE